MARPAPWPRSGGYRVGRISEQHDLASRERRHRLEIENVGPNQRVWRGATEHLRDRLMKVCKEGSDALQIQLGQSGIISSSSAAAGKPVDSVAWDGGEAEPPPRSPALTKPGRVHPAWHARRNGPPARGAGKMLACRRKQRLAHRRVNAVAGKHEISLDSIAIRKVEHDPITSFASADTLHSRANDPVLKLRKKPLVEIGSMEHSHREMIVTAAEFLEVRGLEHLSPLVQEIEPAYRLRPGNDRLVETKRTEGTKRVRAEAESGSERLDLFRLFINRNIPVDETQALRRR